MQNHVCFPNPNDVWKQFRLFLKRLGLDALLFLKFGQPLGLFSGWPFRPLQEVEEFFSASSTKAAL